MENDDNILNDNFEHPLSEERLNAYLNGRLSDEERHAIEQHLAADSFESDAIEGLNQIPHHTTASAVHHINHKLDRSLRRKNNVNKRLQTDRTTWLAIIIILVLTVVAYLVIKLSVKP